MSAARPVAAGTRCRWWALCRAAAEVWVDHEKLGRVAMCKRCAELYKVRIAT